MNTSPRLRMSYTPNSEGNGIVAIILSMILGAAIWVLIIKAFL